MDADAKTNVKTDVDVVQDANAVLPVDAATPIWGGDLEMEIAVLFSGLLFFLHSAEIMAESAAAIHAVEIVAQTTAAGLLSSSSSFVADVVICPANLKNLPN